MAGVPVKRRPEFVRLTDCRDNVLAAPARTFRRTIQAGDPSEPTMASTDRFLLACVMGWPISQSRSPALHNFWFAQHGLAGSYVPLAVPPERLEAALRALPALNFAGCNLTIPLKQDAMKIVDEVDITAKKIGAMSCVVVRPDGSLAGSNNDWYGFTHNILEFVPDWRADAGPVGGDGRGRRRARGGLRADGARRARDQAVQPHAGAGADAGEGLRRTDHGGAVGRSATTPSKARPCW